MQHLSNKTPLPRTWFMARGYTMVDPSLMDGCHIYIHPHKNTALNQFGQQLSLQIVPFEKFRKTTTRYLKFNRGHGHKYLAYVKYVTFVGPVPPGFQIDHIDGDTMNNSINNLRAVPAAINYRDAGFLRKLRNKGIKPTEFRGCLLAYYVRMAEFKSTHTRWQYDRLTRDDLMRLLLGPTFTIVDPDILDQLEPLKHI